MKRFYHIALSKPVVIEARPTDLELFLKCAAVSPYPAGCNGIDYRGKQLSSGVYFCRMNTGACLKVRNNAVGT